MMIVLNLQIIIYQRKSSNVKNIKDNCGLNDKEISSWKTKPFSLVMKTIDIEPGDCIFVFFNDFVRKLIYNFFNIIDEKKYQNKIQFVLL